MEVFFLKDIKNLKGLNDLKAEQIGANDTSYRVKSRQKPFLWLVDFENPILMLTFALIGKIVIFNAYP